MEYWDLYDKNRKKINKTVKRGDPLQDDEYHLVVNAWIKNDKNEFLITQRSENKKFAFMWECTGGSVLQGETSIEGAIREVKEELGIDVEKSTGKLIGTTLRYYPNCPDIFDVWLFTSNVPLSDVKVQEEEVCNVMWASIDEIKKLREDKKFEANAFFDEVLNYVEEEVYYIGLNANNAICNDAFFKGSITLYPTKERGNIYYSSEKIEDTKSDLFLEKYKKFVYMTAKEIQRKNSKSQFICFNEKIRKLCSSMDDINIVKCNDSKIIDFLNNKFETRKLVKDIIPILDYKLPENNEMTYDVIKNMVGSDKIVVQAETGAGGDSTFLVTSEKDIDGVTKGNINYCISKYIKHLPLNATLIIGDNKVITLPISAQLILLTENRFKYVGGDFIRSQSLPCEVVDKINNYSLSIGERVKSIGYRGILGIDYILCENNEIKFMEINPRFQSSSFLISLELERECHTNVAELHYQAMVGKKLKDVDLKTINKSFVNCSNKEEYSSLRNYEIIENGYFKNNDSSVFRKVFNSSIINLLNFEKLDNDK